MADENRDARGALTRRLVEEGHRFSFFQAVRLIERLRPDAARVGHQGPVAREAVRFRPALDFSFAPSDIASIEETPDGFAMTITFLGLYGAVSPCPATSPSSSSNRTTRASSGSSSTSSTTA